MKIFSKMPPIMMARDAATVRYTVQVLLLAGLYFAAGQASFSLSVFQPVLFAAEGFALAAVIFFGPRLWLGIFLGQLMLALYNGLAWHTAFNLSATISLEAVIGAILFHRFALQPTFEKMRDVCGLLLLIFFVLQPFGATLGLLLLWLDGSVSSTQLSTAWLAWWFGNALGQALITPLLLSFLADKNPIKVTLHRSLWLILLVMPISIIALFPSSLTKMTIAFTLTMPLLILIAAKGGIAMVTLATVIMTTMSLFFTKQQVAESLAAGDSNFLLNLDTHILGIVLTGQFIAVLLTKYKRVLLSQVKATEHLQKIAEHFPGAVYQFRLNPDGSFCFPYASVGISNIYRVHPKEVQENATKVFTVLHPEDHDQVITSLKTSAQNLMPWQQDYRVCFEDGTVRWLSGHSMPQREANGATLWHGFVNDVTELKQKEIEYQAIVEASFSGFFCADFFGRFLTVNSALCRMLGYSEQALLNMSIMDIEAAENPDDIAAHIQAIIQTKHDRFETRHRCKNGDILDVEINVLYVETLGQRFFVFVNDISERKRMEAKLCKKHDELQHYFEQPFIGMLTATHNKHTIHVNQRFCDIVGYSKEEMQHIDWGKLTHPDDIAPNQVYLDQAIRGEIDSYQMEKRYIHKNGHIVYVDLAVNCVRNEQGQADYFIGMMLDITERKQVENALHESKALLQTAQRAARMGHYVLNLCTMTWTNDALFDEICGIEHDFVRTMANWQRLIHPDDLQRVLDTFSEIFNDHKRFPLPDSIDSLAYRIIRPQDGVECWVEAWAYNFYDHNGQPIQQVGMVQDITERKLAEQQLQKTTEQLQLVLEGGHLGFWDWNIQTGEVQRNNIWAEMLGYTAKEISNTEQQWENFVYADDRKKARQSIANALEGRTLCHELEYRMLHKDGSIRWILDHASVVQRDANGKPTRMSGTHTDITKLKRLEEQLRESENFFQSLAQINPVGIYRTDVSGNCIFVNPKGCEIIGMSRQQAEGNGWREAIMVDDREKVYNEWAAAVHEQREFALEYRIQQPNGKIIWVYGLATAIRDETHKVSGYIGTITDITERKAIEEYINHLAFYDPLTQLPNRRLLQERLQHGIEINHRNSSQIAVLMMDLDKFKAVNDNLGHAAGDELLQQVANRIKARLREMDMVARLGGDEFVVLLENIIHFDHVARVADDIIHTLSQPFTLYQHHEVYIGTSIGIAIHPQHGDDVTALMDNADTALYYAKNQGRGCFAYFSEALTQKARERLALESRLRNAIEQQELRVYFQPQIDMCSGRLIGAEALVRWHDPDYGCLAPSHFIALAEKTGVCVHIGEWVLRETCRFGRQWLDDGLPPICLAVNVSPHQFRRCNLNTLVANTLKDTRFPAHYLALEMTETGLMNHQEHAMSILNKLHDQGVRIAIDDFGTGYSSLAYLNYFPIDLLKIDKTFIDKIPVSPDDKAITSAIIAIAHHLGFKVLAEGVETIEQLAFLQAQGCDSYQGHLYSKALPADDFAQLLFTHH